ncbi:MAG: hypothetical protein KDD22_00085 [Bdellovibrionales bacterium]|nr:hypothetical protein [Bdellovibrionales bacterium]
MIFSLHGLLSLFSIFSLSAKAVEIPKRLDSEDRREVVRTLGLNTSSKILSNPYPLGGYSGLEFGMEVEFVDVADLSRLGCQSTEPSCPNSTPTTQEELQYARITVGKGLYKDIDFFVSFTPPFAKGINDFGGMVRWSFFQAKFLPINISLVGHINRLRVNDQFISENLGGQIIAGINVDNFSLYFGGGYLRSEAQFLGGDTGSGTIDPNDPLLNSNTNTIKDRVYSTHTLVGFSLHFDQIFTAIQFDRYRDAVVSAKLGLRL